MPVPTPTSRMRAADALGRGDRRLAAALEHRAEHEVVDRRPARVGLGDASCVELARHRARRALRAGTRQRAAATLSRAARGRRRARRRRDEAAAEHARLALGRVVEHAGLPGRHAVLAVDQLDLDAAGAARSQAGCGGRVERTLTKTSRRPSPSACSSVPSPSQFTSRSCMRLVRSASRGPTTTRREAASSRTT